MDARSTAETWGAVITGARRWAWTVWLLAFGWLGIFAAAWASDAGFSWSAAVSSGLPLALVVTIILSCIALLFVGRAWRRGPAEVSINATFLQGIAWTIIALTLSEAMRNEGDLWSFKHKILLWSCGWMAVTVGLAVVYTHLETLGSNLRNAALVTNLSASGLLIGLPFLLDGQTAQQVIGFAGLLVWLLANGLLMRRATIVFEEARRNLPGVFD